MKNKFKQLTTGLALMVSTAAFSQVGINTETPHASADLELASTNKTLYLNRVADPATDVANPQEGMILYDTTMKCLRAFQGDPASWSGCLNGGDTGTGTGTITALNCASATFAPPSGTVGQEYSGTLTVPYSGGNGGTYSATYFTVNGLTFFLPAGSFATGNGNLVYQIMGTPTTAGSTSVEITIGGQSCSGANALSLQINPAPDNPVGVLPSSITLVQNRVQWIASIYDVDYLPYTAPTGPATTAVLAADGTPDTPINIPGTITTTGITVQIPVDKITGSGSINAWSNIITIPANMTQDGVSRQVELSWIAQAYTTATRSITATIKAIGGTLNVKQLDLNAGLGNDYKGVLMGAFQYPYNSTGSLTNYELRDIPGIPDRMFGKLDNTPAAGQRHNFLYMPVLAEDGRVWLNNNLGANYSKIGHAAFDLNKQATADDDFNAFGSLFQWGRKPDGHELINYTSAASATPVNSGSSSTKSDDPTHSLFINATPDWRVNSDDNLWKTESSPNNPCPIGFRPASVVETGYWQLKAGIQPFEINNKSINTLLKIPYSSYRYSSTVQSYSPAQRTTWTGEAISGATSSNASAYGTVYRNVSGQYYDSSERRYYAMAVRCIQD